ncbi:MAG: hypothetical protein ACOYWZ_22550 [Bacillota bacterium]
MEIKKETANNPKYKNMIRGSYIVLRSTGANLLFIMIIHKSQLQTMQQSSSLVNFGRLKTRDHFGDQRKNIQEELVHLLLSIIFHRLSQDAIMEKIE